MDILKKQLIIVCRQISPKYSSNVFYFCFTNSGTNQGLYMTFWREGTAPGEAQGTKFKNLTYWAQGII